MTTQTRTFASQQAHPEVPWKNITGIPHRIVHDYIGVDYDILWEVVTRHIPSLIKAL
ncbi:MAG: DUF86 domain-containing protein [Deltaproteobacteria bacterium]|nr:DUF86 domain-containing protein [Deltaproteobacteria bacterium]